MFGTRTSIFVALVVGLACIGAQAATAKPNPTPTPAAPTYFFLKGQFTETQDGLKSATVSGTFYYMYNVTDPIKSRLRFTYNLPNGASVSNLYDFFDNALYSMCDTCTGERIFFGADKWWYDSNMYSSTNITQNGMTWYVRNAPAAGERNGHVLRILMSSADLPNASDYKLGAIEFAESSGRKITVKNVEVNPTDLSTTSSVFYVDSGVDCPKATCPMLADIVFVLDYSGSVNTTEWMQGVKFVIDVMQSFTFGTDAVEAAIVMFNGPDLYASGRIWNDTVVPNCSSQRAKADTNYNYHPEWYPYPGDRTAKVLAGKKIEVKKGSGRYSYTETYYTVSSDRESLIQQINKTLTPKGDTCQSYGLNLSMEILNNSRKYLSDTGRYDNENVNTIIIVVTDGADMCPNKTNYSAQLLKKNVTDGGYGAFLIEVGVGLECEYDREYLRGLASSLVSEGTSAYYDVTDYSRVQEAAETLFKPLCEDFTSGCGAECLGFCGCGKCFCGDCDTPQDMCINMTCSVNNTYAGCAARPDPCEDGNVCLNYICDSDAESKEQRCVENRTDCSYLSEQNPGSCRVFECDPAEGGCYMLPPPADACRSDVCEHWECGRVGVLADDNVTGCVLIKNQTKLCEEELGKMVAEGSCFSYGCHLDYHKEEVNCMDWIEDTCGSLDDSCYYYKCELDNNTDSYKCKQYEFPHEQSTPCKEIACVPGEGWKVIESSIRNATTCPGFLNPSYDEDYLKCKTFFCNNSVPVGVEPCDFIVRENCNFKCGVKEDSDCMKEALDSSTDESCSVAQCAVRRISGSSSTIYDSDAATGDVDYETYCVYETEDCTSNANRAKMTELNRLAANATCGNLKCVDGSCQVVYLDKPNETRCRKAMCITKNNGAEFEWVLYDTEELINCHSDACWSRTCDPNEGCIRVDNLCNTTTACWYQNCSNGVCKNESSLRERECRKEVCVTDEETGLLKKEWVEKPNVRTVCNNTDLCIDVSCSDEGYCVYKEQPQPFEDPCSVFVCDNKTGWSITPKCHDDKWCTTDSCLGGRCVYEEISCTEVMGITESCYIGECKEGDGEYFCQTGLVNGAIIDICGVCIFEELESSSEEQEMGGDCLEMPKQEIPREGLAAVSIALIILGAVIIGAALATSGVVGTKTLIERARAANNQSAQTNPLFEDNEAEMVNPAFVGEQ